MGRERARDDNFAGRWAGKSIRKREVIGLKYVRVALLTQGEKYKGGLDL